MSTEPRPRRFDYCQANCTADCGHCKGDPVGALRARLAEVEAERDEARAHRDNAMKQRDQAIENAGYWHTQLEALIAAADALPPTQKD